MIITKINGEFIPIECNHQKKKEVCCICGRVINGYSCNPNPFMLKGRCCEKCDKAYVMPIRILQYQLLNQGLSKKKIEKHLAKFRKQHRVLTYEELPDKEKCFLGEMCAKSIEHNEIFYAAYKCLYNDDGIPVEQLTFEEVITCITDYLKSIGKTISGWLEEVADKDVVWLRHKHILAPRKCLIPEIFADEESLEAHRHMAGVNSIKFLLERMDAERVAEAESAAVN